MRGYIIDVMSKTHHEVAIEGNGNLDQYYRLIGCRCIDITERRIGDKRFNVVCDDEGLLVERPRFSVYDKKHDPMMAGTVILFGVDEQSWDLRSLTDDEVEAIKGSIRWAMNISTCEVSPVVIMEY